jgi:hypothetical protein
MLPGAQSRKAPPSRKGAGQKLICVSCGGEGTKNELESFGLALYGHGPPDSKKSGLRNASWAERSIPWIEVEGEGRQTRITKINWPACGGSTCARCARKVVIPKGGSEPLAKTASGIATLIEAARGQYREDECGDAPPKVYSCVGKDGKWVVPMDSEYAHGPVLKPEGNWTSPELDKPWRMESGSAGNPSFKYTCAGLHMHPSDPQCRKTAAATALVPTSAAAAEGGYVRLKGPATAEQAAAILRNQEEAVRERKLILDQQKRILEMLQNLQTPPQQVPAQIEDQERTSAQQIDAPVSIAGAQSHPTTPVEDPSVSTGEGNIQDAHDIPSEVINLSEKLDDAVRSCSVEVGPSLIEGAGQGLIATRDIEKGEFAGIGYTGKEITREQANILEKAGLGTHIKSDRDTGKIIDGHPRHTDNQAQVAAQTANTICKEEQPFVCDSTKVNARYVFDSTHKWGDLKFLQPVKKGEEIYVKYGDKQVTQTTFGRTSEKPPLTVLLATSASATKFEELILDCEPKDRMQMISEKARPYQLVKCDCEPDEDGNVECTCEHERINADFEFECFTKGYPVDQETELKCEAIQPADMIVFNAKQQKVVTAECIKGHCQNQSTWGPYCEVCLREHIPGRSYAIVEQAGKGRALQTLCPISKDEALADIPYVDSNLNLKEQGHTTHTMSTKQLEVLYGSRARRGGREKTVDYGWSLPGETHAVAYFTRSCVVRFANCGGPDSCFESQDYVQGHQGKGFVVAKWDVSAGEMIEWDYGEGYWAGKRPIYTAPVPVTEEENTEVPGAESIEPSDSVNTRGPATLKDYLTGDDSREIVTISSFRTLDWKECFKSMRHGDGPLSMQHSDGWSLELHRKNHKNTGTGKITSPEGWVYEGQLKQCRPFGTGKMTFYRPPPGESPPRPGARWRLHSYEGIFDTRGMTGTGTITFIDGEVTHIKNWKQYFPGMSKKKQRQKRRASKDQDALIAQLKARAEIKMPNMKRSRMHTATPSTVAVEE